MTTSYIYGLMDNVERKIKYVGQTIHPTSRLNSHRRSYKYKHTPTTMWIKSVIARGHDIEMVVFEECDKGEADKLEIEYIAKYREIEPGLKNLSEGGRRGASCGHAKLNKEKVVEIRTKYKTERYTTVRLGVEYGVTDKMVYDIVVGAYWNYVPGAISKDEAHRIACKMNSEKHRRLTDDNVKQIRELSSSGMTQRKIAQKFGVDQSVISRIINRRYVYANF